ncbi:MAG: MBL fold metallo-hydrolase [Actinomycetota bacterium]|jgi:L-ascorbate metabolism protein UlaG (beta-lactamase superfamily)|nr:MBL fold metallo-hydrolase [Actinomycetota bacterium]
MRLRKLGHSCVLVEDRDVRLLVDPGGFTPGFEDLTDLTAVLVTHAHPDHLDLDRLPALLSRNPDARVLCDAGSAVELRRRGVDASALAPGDEVDLGVPVRAVGGEHALIHPDLPRIPNVGYLLDGRLLHPGDALLVPDVPVDVLCFPLAAPWSKVQETVDYVRAVAPAVGVPVHDAILARPEIWLRMLAQLGPEGMRLEVLEPGRTLDVH